MFETPGRGELTMNLSKVAVGSPLDFAPGFCSSDVRADPYSSRLNYYVGGTYAIPALGRASLVEVRLDVHGATVGVPRVPQDHVPRRLGVADPRLWPSLERRALVRPELRAHRGSRPCCAPVFGVSRVRPRTVHRGAAVRPRQHSHHVRRHRVPLDPARGKSLRMDSGSPRSGSGRRSGSRWPARASMPPLTFPSPDAPCWRCAHRAAWSGRCREPRTSRKANDSSRAARRECAASARTRSAVASTSPTASGSRSWATPCSGRFLRTAPLARGPDRRHPGGCRQHRAARAPDRAHGVHSVRRVRRCRQRLVTGRGIAGRHADLRDARDRSAAVHAGGPDRLDIAGTRTRRPPARRIATWRSDTRPRRSTA